MLFQIFLSHLNFYHLSSHSVSANTLSVDVTHCFLCVPSLCPMCCRFQLKQEQEKHRNASMLYDKNREMLRRKEEELRAEAEEKHKVELAMRNLELEMRAILNNMKQVECTLTLFLSFSKPSSSYLNYDNNIIVLYLDYTMLYFVDDP